MYILIIGAHPDDCESHAGGCAALWRKRGDEVRFLLITDGRRGHYDPVYLNAPERLIARRRAESEVAGQVVGASVRNLGVPEGEVMATVELTETLVREIRAFGPEPGRGPDLVVTNRPADHPRDHRYGAQAVVDAAGLLTMPLLCSEVPPLSHAPVFAYWHDDYTEQGVFRPDVVVAIDGAIRQKTEMFGAHVSQVFEWLPYVGGLKDDVPGDPHVRLAWLRSTWVEPVAAHIRSVCSESFDAKLPHGRFVEAFQISECGRQPTLPELQALFPSGGENS